MIIQKLVDYYNLLVDEGSNLPRFGYAVCNVDYALNISAAGELKSVMQLKEGKVRAQMQLPVGKERTSGIAPFFTWDNNKYVLGLPLSEAKNAEKFTAFVELHEQLLSTSEDREAQALLAFLRNWQPQQAAENAVLKPYLPEIEKGANLIFRLEGTEHYLQENLSLRQIWQQQLEQRDQTGQKGLCLVTGEQANLELTHPAIKNLTVIGANAKGGALVSYNDEAFCSYGKKQSLNGPIGTESVFAYTTALNYLLNDRHHRLKIDNLMTVFWADKLREIYEPLTQYFLNPQPFMAEEATAAERQTDEEMRDLVRDLLVRVRSGQPLDSEKCHLDTNVEINILGLTANNARLAVSFWYTNSFGKFVANAARHHLDMEIYQDRAAGNLVSIAAILRETVPKNATNKNAPTIYTAPLLRAILNNTMYPSSVYAQILNRIRIDKDVNAIRSGFLKAYLLRKNRIYQLQKEEEISVSLNQECTDTAYCLGRLFAVLEKAQQDALGRNLSATIKDRYFGTAMTTPAAVFPTLLKLSAHHTGRAAYGYVREKEIREILNLLTADPFPHRLNLDEQGMFSLGYYHQTACFYTKKSDQNEQENNEQENNEED